MAKSWKFAFGYALPPSPLCPPRRLSRCDPPPCCSAHPVRTTPLLDSGCVIACYLDVLKAQCGHSRSGVSFCTVNIRSTAWRCWMREVRGRHSTSNAPVFRARISMGAQRLGGWGRFPLLALITVRAHDSGPLYTESNRLQICSWSRTSTSCACPTLARSS